MRSITRRCIKEGSFLSNVELMSNKRNASLDIAKAICIILMVIGHSGCPTYLHDFVYMFHMPCFFFISGWLLSNKYLSDLKKGLYQKTKASYFPFVKWTLIFLIFHNVFASMHIYENCYSSQMFIERIVRTLTMTGGESLLGGFWFLISLFWASIISLLFFYILSKKDILTEKNISGGVILTVIIAIFLHFIPIKLPQMFGEQTLLAIAFYMSGYLCRKKDIHFDHPLMTTLLLLLVPAIAACIIELNMVTVHGWLVLAFYVIAIAGVIGVVLLSRELSKHRFALILAYIGGKTLYVLVFHLLAFKFVSFLYICINDLPIKLLTSFPVLEETNTWLWIVYSIVGVIIPLLFWKLSNYLKLTALYRITFVKQK